MRGELVGTGGWVGPGRVVSKLTGGEELEDVSSIADDVTAGGELAARASDGCADCALLSTGVEVEDAMNPEVAATEDVLAWTTVKDSRMEGEVEIVGVGPGTPVPVSDGLVSVIGGLVTVNDETDGWILETSTREELLVGTGDWVGPGRVVSKLTGGEELEDVSSIADDVTAGGELAARASDGCADCALLSTGVEVEDAMNPEVAATEDVLTWTRGEGGREGEGELELMEEMEGVGEMEGDDANKDGSSSKAEVV